MRTSSLYLAFPMMPCAFTPDATCPLPPRQNRLGLAVLAGEKKYAGGVEH